MPARLGSMSPRRRAIATVTATDRGSGAPGSAAAACATEADPAPTSPLTNQLHELLEERTEVSSAILELVEDPDAGADVAVGHRGRRTRRSRRRLRGRAGPGPVASSMSVAGRSEELVEHRFGVAHAAGGEPGDQRRSRRARRRARRPRGSGPACLRSRDGRERRTSKRCSRDRIAGGKSCGWVEANMKTTKSGGSSSDLRRAFQASFVI